MLKRCRESKLRKPEQISLGPEYTGSRISRDALEDDDGSDDPFRKNAKDGHDSDSNSDSEEKQYDDPDVAMKEQRIDQDEEIDSEEAFEEGDEEKFQTFAFRGSRASRLRQSDPDVEGELDAQLAATEEPQKRSGDDEMEALEDSMDKDDTASSSVEDEEEDIDMSGLSSSDSEATTSPSNNNLKPSPQQSSDRALLRKLIADSQATVLSTITTAAAADAAKGKAIKHQRSTFDHLLSTRIKLQKALITTNSLQPSSSLPSAPSEPDQTAAILAAEQAALTLWNTLDTLLTTLDLPSSSTNPPSSIATPLSIATPSTPLPTLQSLTLAHTTTRLPHHRTTLTKWSHKTTPAPPLSRSKFAATPTQTPLTTLLDQHLSNTKLLARTRVPRACAPAQAALGLERADDIYDDTDSYTLLLRELVDQRMASSSSRPMQLSDADGIAGTLRPGMKDRSTRVRKRVDTRASKGRKMRYTVHEKLMNFMAPEERGGWGERQRVDLFAGLLGRRVRMGEGSGDEEGEEREEEEGQGALMLFRR